MEMFLQEMCKVMFGWWWFGHDGQTKTANTADRYIIMPVLIVFALGCLAALLVWRWR